MIDTTDPKFSYLPNTSKYENNEHQKSLMNKRDRVIREISILEKDATTSMSNLQMMDWIEKVIYTCGGEPKTRYLEVNSSFIKCYTRVPMEANLFQFLPESQDNPRFHKVVTKLLLLCVSVSGVRWMPSIEGERGSYILVSLNTK